ncbi:uncharacterized protein Dvir_GJ17703 [Drosophila virilis]|uniref:SCP domain-containing protein n=1 Tax=Drosophila virilis TaxID=7244 RepID=B4LSV5_DROVI|nr:venom allergen 3 homolog [Drosophila virilis]EDW64866.2 uncharacterized protein Dvir_GJ17703 [Drosophila virilis]
MKIVIALIVFGYIGRLVGQDESDHDEDDLDNPYYFNFGSKTTICPQNASCLDGNTHFLCAKDPMKVSPNCKRFVLVPITRKSRSNMVHVHNGLRNKVAYDKKLANMNLVYWNMHLQDMAEQYLHLCRPYRDTCLIIGLNGYRVGQNTVFVPRQHFALLTEWEGRTVRQWFLELGRIKITSQDLVTEQLKGKMGNLTQLIWPSLEFIGCSAAIMFDGLFIVCYYYPAVNESLKAQFTYLKADESCVCPKNRYTCSLLFTSLCGIDIEVGGALITEFNPWNMFLLLFILFILYNIRFSRV